MSHKLSQSIGFKMMAFYILLSLINLSFVISIIFENQVDLISKNAMLESEKQLSQLIGSMKKFSIEMKSGSLFKVKDEKEALSQFIKIINLHHREFVIFSDKGGIIYKSSLKIELPETYKEDGLRSMTSMAFSGKDYYLRIDDNNKVINFYIPLGDFLPGDSILLIKKNIDRVNKSLTGLYKQAVYIIFVVLFFHIVFAFILYRSIIQPVKNLGEAAEKLSNGDLGVRVPATGKNSELDTLTATFNRMAESIDKNVKFFSIEMDTVKNIQKVLKNTEIRDELTGLLNENYIAERIDDELNQSKLKRKDISLILINPDDFSRINGIYGTQTGDIMLKEAARKILESCSRNEIIARFGGEEFAVLSPGSSVKMVTDLAEKIRFSINNNEVVTPDGKISMTVSIGITYIRGEDLASVEDKDDVVASARLALQKAKRSGKNRVEFNS